MSDVTRIACELLRRPSITPDEAGCYEVIRRVLEPAGFRMEIDRTPNGTVNAWCTHGSGPPLFVFAGHVDVVPPGPAGSWTTPPFEPAERGGRIYARGAADMKGSDAAALVAFSGFVRSHPDHRGTIALLFTSDEEGDGSEGTSRVVSRLQEAGVQIDWCIVGEPSSAKLFGDTVKNGRRGSLNCTVTVHGRQGHVAYPHLARNPVHDAVPFLAALTARRWDDGVEQFGPTTFQVSNISAGTGATNVIPGECRIMFNFRYNTLWTAEKLIEEVESAAAACGLMASFEWKRSASPFLTRPGRLCRVLAGAIAGSCGLQPSLSTSGGTSDARFISRISRETVEFGPVNATIHCVNENVGTEELEKLADIYRRTAESLLS